MSSAQGNTQEVAEHLRRRLGAGLRQIAFFIVPSAMAFLALGDVVAAALMETGRFTASGCSVSGNATVRRRGRTESSEGSVGGVDSAIAPAAAESVRDAAVVDSFSLM